MSNNIESVICDKCKSRVSKLGARTYTLTLSNKASNRHKGIDKITLCNTCDSNRNTTLTKYVNSG
jgi:heterodisulfide reductase subunit B